MLSVVAERTELLHNIVLIDMNYLQSTTLVRQISISMIISLRVTVRQHVERGNIILSMITPVSQIVMLSQIFFVIVITSVMQEKAVIAEIV